MHFVSAAVMFLGKILVKFFVLCLFNELYYPMT